MNILQLFINIVIYGLIFYVLWWALATIAPAEPFYKIGKAILVIITVIVLIGLLTGGIAPFHMYTGYTL